MRLFPILTAALLGLFTAGCQTSSQQAVDVETAVFKSDRGDDIRELWVVEAGSRRKMEPLIEGPSSTFTARFSPSKEWLAVDEKLNEEFTMTRLFHHEPSGGFRRIPEEEFILDAYNKFLAGFKLQDPDLASRSVTVEKWVRGDKSLILRLEARSNEGKSFSTTHEVDLTRFE
ncbi:MAG: hypothetical protein ACKO2G_16890 [Verrucomicrobiales bacterium]